MYRFKLILVLLLFIPISVYSKVIPMSTGGRICATNVSERFEGFLSRFEGVHYKVYNDHGYRVYKRKSGGFWKPRKGFLTVGVGHKLTNEEIRTGTIKIKGISVNLHEKLKKWHISALLERDVQQHIKIIRQHVNICLKPHEFDALASFVFNLGYGGFFLKSKGKINFSKPTKLLKYLNQNLTYQVYMSIKKYVMSGNVILDGLVRRRNFEAELFYRGKYE